MLLAVIGDNHRHTLSSNQSLIRQRFRFNDIHLNWITQLLSPYLADDTNQPWAISKRRQVESNQLVKLEVADTISVYRLGLEFDTFAPLSSKS